jgi:Uma2 family endonuclease
LEALDSEPEPDVNAYGTGETRPPLVVEIADSSLRYDLHEKAALYAEAGVPEYWVVNLVDQVVEVHRHPRKRAFDTRFHVPRGQRISPEAWPDLELDVSSFFPSAP